MSTTTQVVKHQLTLQRDQEKPPTRSNDSHPKTLSNPKGTKFHPQGNSSEANNATLRFIGTATTILEWEGIRLMTDPNFLHAGDHVHLGPGVTGTRLTNPAVDLHELPNIDVVLLSHYHADHFDEKVESELRRDLPIVTTPHARRHLQDEKESGESFTNVYDLDFWENAFLNIRSSDDSMNDGKRPAFRVTGMPGKHMPPGLLSVANDILSAVPPTNGWMLELGKLNSSPASSESESDFRCGYRIYISGDTLLVDELEDIPKRYADQNIDLMLVHLGGTTVPSPRVPLLMVTMDAEQGVKLMQLVNPDVTIPIHYDDYDVFLSPLKDFRKKVDEAGWADRVVYLDRGDEYRFAVRE